MIEIEPEMYHSTIAINDRMYPSTTAINERIYPTTTVTASAVIRPVKVTSIICEMISIVLLIVSIASPAWLESDGYRQGIWEECYWINKLEDLTCNINNFTVWLLACGMLAICALFINILVVIMTGFGMGSTSNHIKESLYTAALSFMSFALCCLVVALIMFPLMFLNEIHERGRNVWYFEWSYGIGWGSFIFTSGALLLLCIDRNADEIVYKESVMYSSTSTQQHFI